MEIEIWARINHFNNSYFSPFQKFLLITLFSLLPPKRKKKLGYLPNPTKTLRPLSSMQMQFSTQTTHSLFMNSKNNP